MSSAWTSDLNKLLKNWRFQIGKRQQAHLKLNARYNKKHYLLGIPSIMISTASSIGGITTYKECKTDADCAANEYIRLICGIITLGSAVLGALQTFLEYQKQSEAHRSAANNYETLYRLIDTYICVPVSRGDPVTCLKEIQEQYDEIRRTGPPLLDMDDVNLDFHVFKEQKNEPESNSSSSTQDKLDAINRNKTESQEVCIELDLDDCDRYRRPTPPMKNASVKLEQIKRFLKESSLNLVEMENAATSPKTPPLQRSFDSLKINTYPRRAASEACPRTPPSHFRTISVPDDLPELEKI